MSSSKLVRYWDVCAALIPILGDMLQKGDDDDAIRILKALGALEDVDPAKALQEYCTTQPISCKGCNYRLDNERGSCFFTHTDTVPGDWNL